MELCKTDIQNIERLLKQCSEKINKYASPASPDRDLCRRCGIMLKKLHQIKKQ